MADVRRIIVAVDKEIGDGKILVAELAGKKEKIACEEQAPGDTCPISFLPDRHYLPE